MTNDWPRDPAALARALDERITETLNRPMTRGGKQYPKHVPADALDLGERKRPVPEDVDERTPLCDAYNSEDQYRRPVRKDAGTQMNRSKWCRTCAAIVADLPPDKHFTVEVTADAVADGGKAIREQAKLGDDPCPLCEEEYTGFLPMHIREDCEAAE